MYYPHACLCLVGYLSVTALPTLSHIRVLWYVVCTQDSKVLETFPSFSVRQGDPMSLKGKYKPSLLLKELLNHVYSGSPLSAGHILHIFLKVMGYLPMTFHSSQAAQFRQEYNSSSSLPFPFEFYVSSLLCAMHQSTQIQATPHFSFL